MKKYTIQNDVPYMRIKVYNKFSFVFWFLHLNLIFAIEITIINIIYIRIKLHLGSFKPQMVKFQMKMMIQFIISLEVLFIDMFIITQNQ